MQNETKTRIEHRAVDESDSSKELRAYRAQIFDQFEIWLMEIQATSDLQFTQGTTNRVRGFRDYWNFDSKLQLEDTIRTKPPKLVRLLKTIAKELGVSKFEDFTLEKFFETPDPKRENASDSAGLTSSDPEIQGLLLDFLEFVRVRIRKAEAGKNFSLIREGYHDLARASRMCGNSMEAAESLGRVGNLYFEEGDNVSAARMFLEQGIAFYRAGRFPDAEKALLRSNSILKTTNPKHGDIRTELKVWDYMGLTLARLKRAGEALLWFENGDSLKKQIKYTSPLDDASHLTRKAVVLLELRKNEDAIKSLRNALTIRIEKGAKRELARSLKYVALYHFYADKFDSAVVIWGLCLSQQESIGDKAEIGWLNYYLGRGFEEWAKNSDARIGFEIDQIEVITRLTSIDRSAASVFAELYEPIPKILRRKSALRSSLRYYERASEIATEIDHENLKLKADVQLKSLRKRIAKE